uniref:alkaline phosphatase family protein n=1 Tax=Ningiella ruwaisensis TaxID=2364274 RepID=UPI0010A0ABE4|nr:alkaline phosphatase family protein [Ningiella ruwaisensis]
MTKSSEKSLPLIILGPMLRHVDNNIVTLYLVTSKQATLHGKLFDENKDVLALEEAQCEQLSFCVGKHCYIHLLRLKPEIALRANAFYAYNIDIELDSHTQALDQALPELFDCEQNTEKSIPFYFAKKLNNVLHGSCRKAHFHKKDALPVISELLKAESSKTDYPDLLLLTGDQVYVDDVAGPMLFAIHQVIDLLGLHHENFEASVIANSQELLLHEHSFYEREHLFPEIEANEKLTDAFFKGKRKPVFTSVHAHNHLIALNEVIALYLLSWSSRLWPFITLDKPDIKDAYKSQYEKEKDNIVNFCEGLPELEYGLARIPSYMIFDDHDITDDWNLTRGWEEQVYGNPFSKRIVGNALAGYFLFQGIGNPASKLKPLFERAKAVFCDGGFNQHSEFIDTLFDFDQWHYQLNTTPPIQVLDTRTQRWRSESNKNKPSGLMDWEGLCELQQNILGKDSVIMVSAAPVYGVKFIETIQRVFTTFGGALMVDAENWMAHRGTANVMLNIFRHIKTPPNFIILSGDVHYSFVYDVSLRFRRNSPKIVQFTCSGLHNEFPEKLIRWFERINRWLYGHRSPLNWLTKRRNMSVKQRKPENIKGDIVNTCAIGLLQLDEKGHEKQCTVICADGKKVVFTHDD